MTDSPQHGPVHQPGPGAGARTPPLQVDQSEPPAHCFFPVFQHAPRDVDVQNLPPLRGWPFGPTLDPDAYPGAPNNRAKKIKEQGTAG